MNKDSILALMFNSCGVGICLIAILNCITDGLILLGMTVTVLMIIQMLFAKMNYNSLTK